MGHTKDKVEACPELEASEGEEFACPYCSESYESRLERDRCQASHFENTESIPVRTQKRNQGKNIVEDWRRGVEGEEG